MIEIKPNCIYSREDLAAMLSEFNMDVDYFIRRIQPAKRFKKIYIGHDLLEALYNAPEMSAERSDVKLPAACNRGNRKRQGNKSGATDPLEKLIKETA